MRLTYYGPVQFFGRGTSPSLAFVRCYAADRGDRPTLVVVAADPRNLGECPFRHAETLSGNVCLTLGLDIDAVWWVEHHAPVPGHDHHPLGSDRYYLIEFATDGRTPGRRVLRRHARTLCDVERMAGATLAPLQTTPQDRKAVTR